MKNHIFIYITINIFSFSACAQNTKTTATNEKQTKYVDIDVIKTYERVAEKGYKSVDMFQKLGNSYYSNFELDKAARWYGELFAMTSDLESKYYYQYAQSLRFVGENDKANEMLEKFNQKSKAIKEKTFQKQP